MHVKFASFFNHCKTKNIYGLMSVKGCNTSLSLCAENECQTGVNLVRVYDLGNKPIWKRPGWKCSRVLCLDLKVNC